MDDDVHSIFSTRAKNSRCPTGFTIDGVDPEGSLVEMALGLDPQGQAEFTGGEEEEEFLGEAHQGWRWTNPPGCGALGRWQVKVAGEL